MANGEHKNQVGDADRPSAEIKRAPKNIVICCDGTGNKYGEKNTNVVKLFEALEKDDATSQIAYYDPGVGTLGTKELVTWTAKQVNMLKGLAFATGLTQNIEDAYEYLMDKYQSGDRVYLFGFSRGAFTVRALAGMLNRVGLLQKGSNNLIRYATKVDGGKNKKIAAGFKRTFSRECCPYFIGVWDTVESVGIGPFHRGFDTADLNPDVPYGYQALALDEKRIKFKPNLWNPIKDSEKVTTLDKIERDIEQVWFAGVHSDIGGGYEEAGLANIALHWLARKADQRELKINFDILDNYQPKPLGKIHNSLKPLWWVMSWARRRLAEGSLIHKSVKERLGEPKAKYNPRNLRECKSPKYVD